MYLHYLLGLLLIYLSHFADSSITLTIFDNQILRGQLMMLAFVNHRLLDYNPVRLLNDSFLNSKICFSFSKCRLHSFSCGFYYLHLLEIEGWRGLLLF